MQSIPTEYLTAIRRGHDIKGKPLVIAEWNFNHLKTTEVNELDSDNTAWPYNKQYFPIGAITDRIRPKSGIFYAFADNESYTMTNTGAGLSSERFYTIETDSKFKYYMSPLQSETYDINISDPAGPIGEFKLDKFKVKVDYESFVKSNKIRIGFNLGTIPKDWSIEVFEKNANAWVEIADRPDVDAATGLCEIWWNGSAWVDIQQLDESIYQEIKGVRIHIRTVADADSRIQLLEIAAMRELDLTYRVSEYSIDMSMDEEDFIYPVGQISSNSASIVINDYDLKISNKDPASDFFGLLNVWCQFRLYVDYDLSDYSGAASYKARVATMYTSEWQQTNEYEYTLEVFDVLKILQDLYCPAMLVENESIARTMSTILDQVAVDSYSFQSEDFDTTATVKYFWTNGEETVYEAFQKLCESHQCAIFCDEFGVIQLVTRSEIANETDTPVWTFLAEEDGLDIPDIATFDRKYELIANDVTIKYKKMQAKVDELDLTNQPLTSVVWEPDDTVTLRASALQREITSSGVSYPHPTLGTPVNNSIWIDPAEAATWQYKGSANIDGEVFEYNGKGYFQWDFTAGTKTEVIIYNDDEKRKKDLETWNSFTGGGIDPTRQNHFTGRLVTTKRNVDGRGELFHSPRIADGWYLMHMWMAGAGSAYWPGKYFEWGGQFVPGDWRTKTNWVEAQYKWSWKDSILTCDHVKTGGSNPDVCAVILREFDTTEMREFGTRIRFTPGWGHAGIVLNISDADGFVYDDQGPDHPMDAHRFYQVSLLSTEATDKLGRGWQDEIFCEVKNGNTYKPMKSFNGGLRGIKWQLDNNKWYDLDITYSEDTWINGEHCSAIEVFIDGQLVDTFYTTDRIRATNWGGLFVRGASKVDFDYFYATNNIDSRYHYDDEKFDMNVVQLEPGTNLKKIINFPMQDGWLGTGALSLVTHTTNATIHSLKLIHDPGINIPKSVKNLGTFTLTPKSRRVWELSETMDYASMIEINYTSTNNLSLCYEFTQVPNMAYGEGSYNAPNDFSIYDISKGGYISNKLGATILMSPDGLPANNWGFDEFGNAKQRNYFYEEFGAIAHEIRTFEVDLDKQPAKSINIFLSNDKIRLVDQKYHPTKGVFTLANASRKTEIVNGTEEITESQSIDHSLMLYGYVLEEKGEGQKNVKDEISVRRYGPIKMTLEAEWIHTEEEAEELSKWIVEHWADPMDAVEIEVFSNTFTQIGDKVNIKFSQAGVEEAWLFIVTRLQRDFDNDGFSCKMSLRRVR